MANENRTSTNRVIFHHSASDTGTVDEIRQWHTARGFNDIGYHYIIPRNSHFEPGRKLQLIGAHTSGRNADSVGVCIIGHLSRTEPTDNQINQAARLYHDLCRAYGKRLKIEFHHEECPGIKLDRDALVKTLNECVV
jgi:N-acetylmuramoyl-L-alanine amidase